MNILNAVIAAIGIAAVVAELFRRSLLNQMAENDFLDVRSIEANRDKIQLSRRSAYEEQPSRN